MRGAKPEEQTAGAVEQALSNLRIEVPQEERSAQLRKESPGEAPVQPGRKPEAVRRFEEIVQQELSGTSFSTGFDRRARAQERLAQRVAKQAAAERPLNGAKAITPKVERARAFSGATVLDKLVSFIAYLIKALERRLLGGLRRLLPGSRQQTQKQQQKQLQALSTKKDQARQIAKKGKRGAAMGGR